MAAPLILGNSRLSQIVKPTAVNKTTNDYLSQLLGKPAINAGTPAIDLQELLTGERLNPGAVGINAPSLKLPSALQSQDGVLPNGKPYQDTTGPLNRKGFFDLQKQLGTGVTPKNFGKSGSKNKPNNIATSFAAAMRLAQKEMGGFDATPYVDALNAVQSLAQSQRHQATRTSRHAQQADAVLYGHLNNYVKNIAQTGRQDTRQTLHGVNRDYGNLSDTIANTYGQATNANDKNLAGLGLAGNSNKAAENYALSRAATSRADSKSNERQGGDAFNRLMGQTRADVVATGTGKVADEKAALQNALSTIHQAVVNQGAQIDQARAQGESAYNTQLRQAAMSLLSQMQANNPHSIANREKLASLAHTYAETQHLLNPTASSSAASQSGFTGALDYLKSQSDAGLKHGGIDPSHLQTLDNFVSAISEGGTPYPVITGGKLQVNSNNLTTLLQAADNLISQADVARGYTPVDRAALEMAIRHLVGAR